MDLTEFLEELRQNTLARATSDVSFSEESFVELVTEYLAELGEISEFISCPFKHRGLKVSGYAFLPDEATLDLFVADYDGLNGSGSLTRTQLDASFRRVESFFKKSLTRQFHESLETSHPGHGLALLIFQQASVIARVRYLLISDLPLSGRVKDLLPRDVEGREWDYRVWDLERLAKVMSRGEPEDIVIDFEELFGEPLRGLPAGQSIGGLRSYLAVIPGSWLAKIYSMHSGRLLEQNVRTFLQLKGGVNKGIRQTILNEPQFFFPYNNGISATAEEEVVEIAGGFASISKVRNLQIVNGGQTTASIFNAQKRDRTANIEDIRVQMKLTIVPQELVAELVPKISRYANSQNKISDDDFFSNHPFHIRTEVLSRNIWTPPRQGSVLQTRWFYERARGQFANRQAYLAPAAKAQFLSQHPRSQVITKTDLAKALNTFAALPHIVSLGTQKNFGAFAEQVSKHWKADASVFDETWFQNAVAQVLVFRTMEKSVSRASWYANGYRANTVTYGISVLMHLLYSKGKNIDLRKIWQRQCLTTALERQLLVSCQLTQQRLLTAPQRFSVSNISEWCKKPACWDDLRSIELDLDEEFKSELVPR